MVEIRTTTNKWWLFVGWIFGLFFAIIWAIILFKGIYYWTMFWPIVYDGFQSWELKWTLPILIIWLVLLMFIVFVLIFFGTWLLIFIASVKWCFNLLKKQEIKRNKEWMRKIDAKVMSFESCGEKDRNGECTSSVYYFTASDWLKKYESEDFDAVVTWRCWDINDSLELMEIHYNPQKPEDTIRALDERLHTIENWLQECNWVKALLLKWAYSATQEVRENLKSWIIPCMEFRWHKLSIGDKVSVYIDPENPENYWIDTAFLYS